MENVSIAGGGPAGAAAAIAAAGEGAAVHLFERSRISRHKVCGEFISPAAIEVVDRLGALEAFFARKPSPIRRAMLHFGSREKKWNLPECAYGLSRLTLDRLLLERAAASGARIHRGESAEPGETGSFILARGRRAQAARGRRLFGFKAHFTGPANDAVELFFDKRAYVGVSAVEDGFTNVCGLAHEDALRQHGFDMDELLAFHPLSERLKPLRRSMDWLTVGPVVFSRVGCLRVPHHVYPAGDALGFVDPFTGSGILNAVLTGSMAGHAAARRISSADYIRDCQSLLARPFGASALLRQAIHWNWASRLGALVPGELLFRLTRANLQPAKGTLSA